MIECSCDIDFALAQEKPLFHAVLFCQGCKEKIIKIMVVAA